MVMNILRQIRIESNAEHILESNQIKSIDFLNSMCYKRFLTFEKPFFDRKVVIRQKNRYQELLKKLLFVSINMFLTVSWELKIISQNI